MSKFMFVFRGGAFVHPGLSPAELQAHLAKWGSWIGQLAQDGYHLGGDAVQKSGRTIRGKDKAVTDGPYAELKDLVTGNLVVEAENLDAAADLAGDCPIYEFDGSVEIRPISDM